MDIVERLRKAAKAAAYGGWGQHGDGRLEDDAADEIERLRAALERVAEIMGTSHVADLARAALTRSA